MREKDEAGRRARTDAPPTRIARMPPAGRRSQHKPEETRECAPMDTCRNAIHRKRTRAPQCARAEE
eukprot:833208-Pyramimonas_sp.AAC.1